MTPARDFFLFILIILFLPSLATAGMVTAGSVTGTAGSTVLVPLYLSDGDPVNRIDLTLSYDPKICTAVAVLPGDFTTNTTLEPALDRGEVRITLASSDGISGDGILAWIRFKILATSGSSSLRLLSARSGAVLGKEDGIFTVIPGISFSRTAEGRQRVTVDTGRSAAIISDSAISFSQGAMEVRIQTEGIGSTATFSTGLVQNATVKSSPTTSTLSFGQVKASCALIFPEYLSEVFLALDISETVTPAFQDAIVKSSAASGLNTTSLSFMATSVFYGAATTDLVTVTVTIPSSHMPEGNESFRIASRDSAGTVVLIRPEITDAGDGTSVIQVRFNWLPDSIALITVREVPHPAFPSVATTHSGSILSPGTEAASGNIWTGMIMMFFLIAIVVGAVFFVHRKRGG
ncbi:MAG: hypothetical protein LUQ17_02905 [Methanomicrobiales archaeon]|nr:hypothetical protein [Methanomicrobiales archaeon]